MLKECLLLLLGVFCAGPEESGLLSVKNPQMRSKAFYRKVDVRHLKYDSVCKYSNISIDLYVRPSTIFYPTTEELSSNVHSGALSLT